MLSTLWERAVPQHSLLSQITAIVVSLILGNGFKMMLNRQRSFKVTVTRMEGEETLKLRHMRNNWEE